MREGGLEFVVAQGSRFRSGAPELSVIIVNWNSAEFVRGCVQSIRENSAGLTYEVLVVDNASWDGCESLLKECAPEVKYIQRDKNFGFASANNHAFRASSGTSLLFLNPDTEIVGPSLSVLYRALQRLPAAGAVGARLLNEDGSLQTSCIQSFPTILNQLLDSEYFRKRWPESGLWGTRAFLHKPSRVYEVEGISGACLMIKRDIFESVGGFCEDYFMYAEDMDLCYRVRQTGYKNYYVPEAEVIHFGGSSSKHAPSNFSVVTMRESNWRFLRNTRGEFYSAGYRLLIFFSACCRLTLLIIGLLVRKVLRRRRSLNGSLGKWWAILRWSLGNRGLDRPPSGLQPRLECPSRSA
jgi:N-acetylglucosaminyl-diphospho-decaprenol L-rhamnosyltransferase